MNSRAQELTEVPHGSHVLAGIDQLRVQGAKLDTEGERMCPSGMPRTPVGDESAGSAAIAAIAAS